MWWKCEQQDFQAEIEAHLQLEADELRAEGLAPAEAQAAARRVFGNRTSAEERFYESGGWMFLDHLLRDVRFAARVLTKDARFSGLAILGLALGLGLSTAVFALMSACEKAASVELQDPASYVSLAGIVDGREERLSYSDYRYYRDHATAFRAAYSGREGFILGPYAGGKTETEAEDAQGRFVSANFLSGIGLQPALGRSFSEEEEQIGAPVAVLNFGMWAPGFDRASRYVEPRPKWVFYRVPFAEPGRQTQRTAA